MSQSQEDSANQPGAEVVNSDQENDQTQQAEAAQAPSRDENSKAAQDASEADSVDGLPDWAQKQIKDLRRESANYRTQLQSVKDASVKTDEEFETLKAELAKKDVALVRERIASKHGLPDALRDRLQGETQEDLEADAKAIASLIHSPRQPVDSPSPSGGLDSGSSPALSVEDAVAAARRQRR